MPGLSIVIALYPGVTHLDFTGPHQVLSRVPDAQVVATSMGGRDIEAEGLMFTGLVDISTVERCDVLLVPGGFGCTAAMLDADFIREIRRLGSEATYLTSVCTGSLVLAAAGLLIGRRAACHWAWRHLLEPFGVRVSEARVERDGNVITGGGVTAGLDFAFTLLAELAGQDYAEAVQLGLEYAPSPPFASGRPELARPEVLARVEAAMAASMATRAADVKQAAARLAKVPSVA